MAFELDGQRSGAARGELMVVGQFEKQLNRNDGAVEALKLI